MASKVLLSRTRSKEPEEISCRSVALATRHCISGLARAFRERILSTATGEMSTLVMRLYPASYMSSHNLEVPQPKCSTSQSRLGQQSSRMHRRSEYSAIHSKWSPTLCRKSQNTRPPSMEYMLRSGVPPAAKLTPRRRISGVPSARNLRCCRSLNLHATPPRRATAKEPPSRLTSKREVPGWVSATSGDRTPRCKALFKNGRCACPGVRASLRSDAIS
mmetsp:Transcript_79863/g.222392  ORF Transcript_79863/g.222392 Transcript_79863/m.222392 type:complete len:218 (-) Transcript_79863:57-710(-)